MKKNELLHALQYLQKATTNRELIPQATHLVLQDDIMRTYNGDISVRVPFKTGVTGAVPFDLFYKFVDKFNRDEFEMSVADSKIWLQHKKQKAWFLMQQEIILSDIHESQEFTWSKLPDDFWDTCSLAAEVCSKDVSEIALTCIQVNSSGIVYGTDKKRILKATLSEELNHSFLFIADDFKKIAPFQPSQYSITDNWIHFLVDENIIMSSRRVLGDYPPVASFFNIGKDVGKSVFPDGVIDAFECLELFSKNELATDGLLLVEFSKKRLKLSSNTDIGGYEETMPIKDNTLELSFSIIPYVLHSIVTKNLGFIIEGEKIYFSGENWQYVSVLKISE